MFAEILFKLIFAHCLGDFAFQSWNISKFKNRHNKPRPGEDIPEGQKPVEVWFYTLGAHAMINGGLCYYVSGNFVVGLLETFSHFIVDFIKCENKTTPLSDQVLHFLFKIVYAFYIVLLDEAKVSFDLGSFLTILAIMGINSLTVLFLVWPRERRT